MNLSDGAAGRPGRGPGLRTILKWVRYAPERWLHAVRRLAAQRRLHRQPSPSAVLIICQGNICRSPFAAALLSRRKARFSEAMRVDSAGFIGPGRPSPAEAVTTAARYGVDLTGHRSKLLDQNELTGFDLVVVMDLMQRMRLENEYGISGRRILLLGDLDPNRIETRTIVDPIDRSIHTYEQVYCRIERCIESLVAALQPPDRVPVDPKA